MRSRLARLFAAAVLALLASGGASARADEEPIVRLREALERGIVALSAKASRTYSRITLHLTSRAAVPRTIDLAGEQLEPEGGKCQRLGIGPAVTASATSGHGDGSTRVRLEPGATVSVEVATCCLDSGRPVPRDQRMLLAKTALPEKLEALLRHWADVPATSQSLVNSAVWQGAWDVRFRATQEKSRPADPKGRFVALRGGTAYVLEDGVLRARTPDGNVRFLGTGIWSVHPEEDGTWVVANDPAGGKRRLWRLPVTAESSPPRALLELDSEDVVGRVLPLGNGTAVLGGPGARWVGPDGKVEDLLAASREVRSAALDEKGRLVATLAGRQAGAGSGRFAVITIDPAGREAKEGERFTNIRDLCLLPCGAFALSDDGFLERVRMADGRRFDVDRTRRAASIVGGSPLVLWVALDDGSAVACDPASGRELRRVPAAEIGRSECVRADPVTGDLAWTVAAAARRLRFDDGTIETIELDPR